MSTAVCEMRSILHLRRSLALLASAGGEVSCFYCFSRTMSVEALLDALFQRPLAGLLPSRHTSMTPETAVDVLLHELNRERTGKDARVCEG